MSSGHQDADTLRDKSILDVDGREKLVPIFVEGVSVAKEKVVTGRVKVTTITNNRDKLIDELLMRERVKIERVPVDRPIATIPDIRDDGDTTIIPVVEEVIVVERRLVLKEEIRLRRGAQQ